MPRIQFPLGFQGVENLPRTNRNLQNCFNNGDNKIISRFGISTIGSDTGGVVRGQFKWNDSLYEIRSEFLVKITNLVTGEATIIGIIEGTDVIRTAIGFNEAVLVVKGGNLYTLGDVSNAISISSVGDNAGIAKFNYPGDVITLPSAITITGFIANGDYNVIDTPVTSVESPILITAIDSITELFGVAIFHHTGVSPTVGSSVTLSGYTINTGYNVTALVLVVTATTFILDGVSFITTDITSVGDSGGIANFNHAGLSPEIGATVTISGYTTNTDYNVTGVVTASSPTGFQISSISFGTNELGGIFVDDTDEALGSYTALANFEISTIPFGSDESVGSFVEPLADITNNANFVPCVAVAHINGKFVYIPADGSVAFFSDVGNAGSVQALSFFDAEQLPDKNNSVFNGKNTLFICGTDSIQLYRDTGASPVPFTNISGSRILNGFLGGLLEYNNTFLFIGNEKDQNAGIYSIVQGGAAKISNERIDLLLSTYTEDELFNAKTMRFKQVGYDLAIFKLARDTFGYFGGNWFILDTVVNDVSRPWDADFITEFNASYYVGSDNKFGKLEKVNTDFGRRITRIVDMGFEQEDGNFFSCQSIELGISQGFNAEAGTVAILMSRDNVQYGPALFRSTGKIGQYQNRLIWNTVGGLGNYHGFMGVRFYTTDNIEFSADYVIAKIR